MSDLAQRLVHQCHRDNCDSAAEFGVKVHLTCRRPNEVRLVSMDCTIKVCAKHMQTDDVLAYLRQEQNRETITVSLMDAGFAEPDFLSPRVEFVPILAEPISITTVPCCDRADCHNPAKWSVLLRFRKVGQSKRNPWRAQIDPRLMVCDKHKADTTAQVVLADEDDRATIKRRLNQRGHGIMDIENAEVVFEPVEAQRVA